MPIVSDYRQVCEIYDEARERGVDFLAHLS